MERLKVFQAISLYTYVMIANKLLFKSNGTPESVQLEQCS